MIIEFFLNLAHWFSDWFINLFPDWEPPAEFTNLDSTVNQLWRDNLGGLSVWIPFPLVISCAVAAIGVWATGLGIKAVRAIAAHVPAFGGSG